MTNNLPKHYQVVPAENNLDKTHVMKRKLEEGHQSLTSFANNKHYLQLCKVNAAKSFQNETLPNFNDFAELGKYIVYVV